MTQEIIYTQCPSCNKNQIAFVFKAIDYTVSKKSFEIWECESCTLRFTQNAPSEELIGDYYKDESYISHTNEKKGVINKLYHLVRKFTLQSKRKLINHFVNHAENRILDIGAGTGYFLNEMKLNGWEVSGIEPSEDARKMAFQQHKINLKNSDELFTIHPNSLNIVTMWHVFEHVLKSKDYLNAIHKILKQEGLLIIAVPNYTSTDAEVYKNNWAAYDVPRHVFHFSPTSLIQLASECGFKVKDLKPMWFDSFYVSMLSEKNKNNNLSIIGFVKALLVGIYSNVLAIFDKRKCSSVIYIFEKN